MEPTSPQLDLVVTGPIKRGKTSAIEIVSSQSAADEPYIHPIAPGSFLSFRIDAPEEAHGRNQSGRSRPGSQASQSASRGLRRAEQRARREGPEARAFDDALEEVVIQRSRGSRASHRDQHRQPKDVPRQNGGV